MAESQTLIPTDTWVKATWQDYQAEIARSEYSSGKGLFFQRSHEARDVAPGAILTLGIISL